MTAQFKPYAAFGTAIIKVNMNAGDTREVPLANTGLAASGNYFYTQGEISCVVKEYSRTMRRHYAVFFCVMVHKKVFDKIGYLNEDYGTGSGEDMEFCILAQDNGFEIREVMDKVQLDKMLFIIDQLRKGDD